MVVAVFRRRCARPLGDNDPRPIGMFDSGGGGLTVARSMLEMLPHQSLIYVADTARFPYGHRSMADIRRYALEITDVLLHRDIKMLVVACNSAEACAMDDIASRCPVPLVGVINPTVAAAIRATRNGVIGLIGTEATVRSGAYDRAIEATGADVVVHSKGCPGLGELAHRDGTTSTQLSQTIRRFLAPLKAKKIDTLILGCTAYPLISTFLQMEVGSDVALVSSAEETANEVYAILTDTELEGEQSSPRQHEFLVTGDSRQFQRLVSVLMGTLSGKYVIRPVLPAPSSRFRQEDFCVGAFTEAVEVEGGRSP
ncbi:MAG: glutamate racemase [Egibacteraceae bacterium]